MEGKLKMKLNELCKEAHKMSKSKGWYPKKGRNLAELIALVHSELSEALEEARNKRMKTWYNPINDSKKPEGFPIEIADTVIRIADLCGYLGIDLEQAIKIKLAYNKTRKHKHGGKIF